MDELRFDTRELKEIWHAMVYAEKMAHGTVGHNVLLLLAKFAKVSGFSLDDEGDLLYNGKMALSE